MKKVLGVVVSVLLVFCLAVRVNALSTSDQKLLNEVKTKAQELAGGMEVTTNISGNTVTISVPDISVSFNITLKDNIMTYDFGGDSNESLVMQFILDAILTLRNQGSDATTVLNNISSYSFKTHGIEGTADAGNATHLKVDAKKISLAGEYSSSSSSSTTETTTTTTGDATENPKTGVFVPVVGLSVLIVASVVCLIWISKKNVFKGF